jgi:transglutaminase-like putative cysteine protease
MDEFIITHTTEYIYQEPISLCHNIARLFPRSFNEQVCRTSDILITPRPDVYLEYLDFFGNRVAYFAIEQEHEKLSVSVTSKVEIKNQPVQRDEYPKISWEDAKQLIRANPADIIEVRQYCPETSKTRISTAVASYAKESFPAGRPLFEAAYDLMQRIHKDFYYKPGLTSVSTPVDEVLRLRKGVCQDFAHLAIACLRAMGLAARYVSGYIETITEPGKVKMVGADASHAWFSVFIPGMGWVDFDPTNNQVPLHQHITIGWGCDYSDVAPLKGILLSSRPHKLHVSVNVSRIS